MTGELEAVGFRTEVGFDGLGCGGAPVGLELLAVTQALLGTDHFPNIKNGVLFLEDVNEHPYRIERALLQLHQAGVLDKQKAIVLGAFTEFRKSPLDRGYNLKTVIAYLPADQNPDSDRTAVWPRARQVEFAHWPTSEPGGARTRRLCDVVMTRRRSRGQGKSQ